MILSLIEDFSELCEKIVEFLIEILILSLIVDFNELCEKIALRVISLIDFDGPTSEHHTSGNNHHGKLKLGSLGFYGNS